jgi:hypothetical protein
MLHGAASHMLHSDVSVGDKLSEQQGFHKITRLVMLPS